MSLSLHRPSPPVSQTVFVGALIVSVLAHLAVLLVTQLPALSTPMPPVAHTLSVTLRAPFRPAPPPVAPVASPPPAPVAPRLSEPAPAPAPKRQARLAEPVHAAPHALQRVPAAPPVPRPAAPERNVERAPVPAREAPSVVAVPSLVAPAPAPAGDRYGLLAQARQLARGVGVAAEAGEDAPAAAGRQKAVYGSSARGPDWARYIEDWRLKVERVGYLNYPEEARRQQLTGGPLLTVLINADGSLRSVKIRRGSGEAVLDQAALNIVRLSAPFAPFPPALAERYATLEITRRWTFTTDNRLSSQ